MKTIQNNTKLFLGTILILLVSFTSCDLEELPENVDINDPQGLVEIEELLNASYNNLGWALGGNAQLFADINGDNIDGSSGINNDETEIYNRSTSFFNNTIRDNMYRGFYRVILDANVANSFLQDSYLSSIGVDTSNPRIQEMRGEALLLRGLAHFEISRFMSHSPGYSSDNSHLGIPYRKDHTSVTVNRETVAENYANIVADLKEAVNLLGTINSKNQYYGNKAVAQAYLAKVFFQAGFGPDIEAGNTNYKNAYDYANTVLTATSSMFDDNLYQGGADGTDRFAGNLDTTDNNTNISEPNNETIFGIISESNANNKGGTFRRYRSDEAISNGTIRIMASFYNSIPTTDKRKALFTEIDGEYFLTKFNRSIFHVPLVHYTQIQLIRAESAAEIDLTSIAEVDINKILVRADLSPINGLSKDDLINLIRNQRRIELVGEGNRVNDLKRIGIRNSTLTIRNAPWNCNGILFQFPATEVFTGFTQNSTGGCN